MICVSAELRIAFKCLSAHLYSLLGSHVSAQRNSAVAGSSKLSCRCVARPPLLPCSPSEDAAAPNPLRINGTKYTFNLTVVNIGATTTKAAAVARQLVGARPERLLLPAGSYNLCLAGALGPCRLLIGPYSTVLTTAVAIEIEKAPQPFVLVGTAATSSTIYVCPSTGNLTLSTPCKGYGNRRFQRTWGPITTGLYLMSMYSAEERALRT